MSVSERARLRELEKVARHGQSVLWPARRASNPRRVPRPRDLVEQVSARYRRVARDRDRPVAMLLPPAPLALICVAALVLLVFVAVQTGHGARTAATAYTQGDPVLAEVTSADPDSFTLGVSYVDGGGEPQQAVAARDWPEDYIEGRRYPAVVVPGQNSRVRLLSEPYDAVEPIIWGAIPAAAAGALLLRQHIYVPARRRRRPSMAHLPRGPRPRVLNTDRTTGSLVMFTSAAAAVGLSLLGVVLLIGAVDAWNKTENILERGVLVTGEVSDVSYGRTSSVEVRYRAQDGRAIVQDTVNFVGDYDIGDPIDVIYDPIHPRRMEAADWGTDHVTAYALGTLASISGILAVATVLNLARQRIRDRAARRHQMAGQAA